MNSKLNATPEIAQLTVNTIKTLAMDAVQKANSGHPGMPMGMADCAFVLWSRFLRYDPGSPEWPDRDRFILSAGHGSMLLYSMLHITGYGLSIDEIKQFRQWESRTAGHPEFGLLPGVETTTGPLGQGFANGIGMAIAEKMTAARFNTPDHKIISHKIYAIVSDGEIMEGISSESASIAGHLKLDNIIYIYDDNKITIDGSTNLTFSEDVEMKFNALGWRVLRCDGHNHSSIAAALEEAQTPAAKPTIIIASTRIGCGSPGKQGTSDCHGAPLGAEEVAATKKNIGWSHPDFFVPHEVYDFFKLRAAELKEQHAGWNNLFEAWTKANPALASERTILLNKEIPAGLEETLIAALPEKAMATREFSGVLLQKAASIIPGLVGGSADLAPSNKTFIKGATAISAEDFSGKNFHFGIREHAMGSLMNGIALYGGFIPYGGTFMIFADYMRPPVRLAALMEIQTIYVFTHDSFHVGEDGPTHQPIEHLATLRAIPNLHVFRPADGMETAIAWACALKSKKGPTVLSLTRQTLPILERPENFDPDSITAGAYIISESDSAEPTAIIISTGSEVSAAIEAKKLLGDIGRGIRVVSMPCQELFDLQPAEYKEKIIPSSCGKVAVVEAGIAQGWHKWAGKDALIISIDHFGASAPAKVLAEKFGFTPEKIAERLKDFI